ncbi:hypothetical protein E1B28_011970 [Marasmius oreades]|uniref:Uncharacterized protein n=1 Tax=Marasmius oreades TaxID=181124 RepID=A0A9P7RR91_9AGAR|nr:uncharacterized protein E1B28_011970 [Marasmius oreades]KAG7087923.1 hypothetical protein E1B28_011970 [Marasmius oreades]
MASTSELEEALAPLLSAKSVLTKPISSLPVLFFLYGVYCFTFGLAIHVLFHQSNPVHKLQQRGTIALFTLATIYTAIYTCEIFQEASLQFHAAATKDYTSILQYLTGDDVKTALFGITSITSTLMNSIADTMLIHRCYLIFNSDKFVLFPLAFTACILNGIDLGCIIASIIGYGSTSKPGNSNLIAKVQDIDYGGMIAIAIFQIILSLLTGWCIWWITRQARQFMGQSVCTRYNDIVGIIIESGLLYAGSLLTAVVVEFTIDPQSTGKVPVELTVVTGLMSGLAPTMVITRVAYGKAVESVQQTISTFHIANSQASQQTSTRQETVDIHLQMQPGIAVNDLQGVEEI